MSDGYFRISGGRVHDPTNFVDGQVQDIWIKGGKIAERPTNPEIRPERTLDASGMIVMPGGIDMHCHIAGSKVNAARMLRPDDRRRAEPVHRTPATHSGTLGSVPSTFATGYKYLGMGYTTAFDAAVAPLLARQAHLEFADTPCIDKGFYALLGNNHFVLRSIAEGSPERLHGFVGWLLGAARAYGVKLVNPGGVELWKQHARGNVANLDTVVTPFGVTPRQIVREVARTCDHLRLPHSVHIHANHLGMPGNWRTTLETMEALDGHRGHMTHIQFHSYGGGDGDETTFCSRVIPLVEFVNAHPNITVDVGQVLFGETTSLTGDGPLGYYLSHLYRTRWFNADIEMESGCGIAPIQYRNKSMVHAWQWAIGLEWYLMMKDPWRVAMSTDHPNGGSFLAYPHIIQLLMDRNYRQEILKTVHRDVRERSMLSQLDREYTLQEIAIITRAAPARILGLSHKGHLGPGADADITIYQSDADKKIMFQTPKFVIKAGKLLVEDAEIRHDDAGKTLFVSPHHDSSIEPVIAAWFDECYSLRFRNYAVSERVATWEEMPFTAQG